MGSRFSGTLLSSSNYVDASWKLVRSIGGIVYVSSQTAVARGQGQRRYVSLHVSVPTSPIVQEEGTNSLFFHHLLAPTVFLESQCIIRVWARVCLHSVDGWVH